MASQRRSDTEGESKADNDPDTAGEADRILGTWLREFV
jgi:hypothetical protein